MKMHYLTNKDMCAQQTPLWHSLNKEFHTILVNPVSLKWHKQMCFDRNLGNTTQIMFLLT